MYPKKFNRDEVFFRLGVEKSDDLLEKGADPNAKTNAGQSAVVLAIGRLNDNNGIILEMMLQHGLILDEPKISFFIWIINAILHDKNIFNLERIDNEFTNSERFLQHYTLCYYRL